jgi:hypothetical protein
MPRAGFEPTIQAVKAYAFDRAATETGVLDLLMAYLTTLSVAQATSYTVASNEGMISEWWTGKDVKESGRGLI